MSVSLEQHSYNTNESLPTTIQVDVAQWKSAGERESRKTVMSATGGTTSTATTSGPNIHTVTYSHLGEDDSTGHTGHSHVAWICHACDGVNYFQYAFQSSIWAIDDIFVNQYHPLVDDESDDPV